MPFACSRPVVEPPLPASGGSMPCLASFVLDLTQGQKFPILRLLLELLHVLNEPFVVLEFNLVLLHGDLALGLEEALGKLEVSLLNLMNLSLPHE